MHNHNPTKVVNNFVHPLLWQMTCTQYKIVRQYIETRISPAETYNFLINAYLDMKVVQRDIYNAQEKIKYQKLKGQTRIVVLLYKLEDAKDNKGEEK